MGQIAGYDYDLFISYSHNDNEPLSGHRWVDEFHEALQNWLVKRRSYDKLSIWRDDQLHGNTAFDVAIENRLKSSALFLALYSRNYQKSDYCQWELDFFHRYHADRPGGLLFGEESRILPVLLNNIPFRDWPKPMEGLSGFPMHSSHQEGKLGDFTEPSDDNFKQQLGKIVDAIEAILVKQPIPQPTPAHTEKRIQIFLAETEDGLRKQRKRLKEDLKSKGAEVVDGIPPPDTYADHRAKILRVMEQVDLSVHMLGSWPGRDITDQEDTTYPIEQVEIALTCKTPQTIWVPTDLKIETMEDGAYKNLLQRLETGTRENKPFDFLRCPPTQLTDVLLQKLKELQSASHDPVPEHKVLIDTHQKDQSYAYQLADALSQQGLDVDFNKDSRDPLISLANFERTLREVEQLILMFGKVTPEWLQGRIRKALKVVAEQYDSDKPLALETVWVFLLPGSNGKLPLGKLPPLLRIDVLDNSYSDSIEPAVVSKLLQANGRGYYT